MKTLADLLQSTSLSQWKSKLVDLATSVQLKTENWVEGGFSRTFIALFSQLYATAGDVIRIVAAGGLLDTAEGDWLTLLAHNVFNVDRIEATAAAAPNALKLTNGGGGLYTFKARELVVQHSVSKKTYRNTNGGTLSPGVGQTLTLDLEAEEEGSDSNATIGTITEFVSGPLGVTCTNLVALIGTDEEEDEDLRQRCRNSIAALSIGGVKKAYEYYARSAVRTDGSAIGVTRVKIMPPPGDGTLTVYVADASGAIAGDDVDAVQLAFDTYVTPYGFNATAVSASNVSITAPCTIWIPSTLGLTDEEAQQAVLDALEAYVNSIDINGVVISPAAGAVYWRSLLAVAGGAIPGTLKAQLTSEVDIAVAVGEVPVWGGILADTTVVQVT